MDKNTLSITHLYHSGFMVEAEDKILIFDYFKSPYINLNKRIKGTKKPIYIFVSHSHQDHFNPEIFEWDVGKNIFYILSKDIKAHKKDNYFIMDKYEALEVNGLNIKSFGTTDLGVSFLVTFSNYNIFHAGDLNWWKWKKDPYEVQYKEEVDFKREIDKLKGIDIDIAFIPVDPRLEEYYYLSGEYVATTLNPKLIVPMHFGENYYITELFNKKIEETGVKSLIIKEDSNSFIFK